MKILKNSFYFSNIIIIIFYLYPGSILGCFLYNDCFIQPQLTRDFIVSSNHVYVFFILSTLGFISFSKNIKKITYYLILLSIVLELLHTIIPNRSFEVEDLLGNILGVLLSLILFKLFIFRRLK
jgi:VanZ family protein|tara:strand:+ start:196 stop:567 length:372 start_codon:yes stop_codon:yes gene_type:complete